QRFGPQMAEMPRLVRELDDAMAPISDAATQVGARIWVVSEYGHVQVDRPIFPNRALRQAGLLAVRSGPFGEILENFESPAIAVCDHQLAHVYVNDPNCMERVRDVLQSIPGVARIFAGEERREIELAHPRAGDLILRADRHSWFAYPFWLDDQLAPDYARTV